MEGTVQTEQILQAELAALRTRVAELEQALAHLDHPASSPPSTTPFSPLSSSEDSNNQLRELESIIETLADGLVVYNLEGKIVRTNTAFRKLIHMDQLPAFTEKPLHARATSLQLQDEQGQSMPEEQLPTTRILRGETLTGSNGVDLIIKTLDGRRVQVNVSGAPMYSVQRKIIGAVALFHDVTERRQIELQTQEANRQMDEFLSIASHELRTPLTTINGNIQLARRRLKTLSSSSPELPEEALNKIDFVQELLSRAERQVHVQNRLVGDLLDVSRIQANRLELNMSSSDLMEIVREAVEGQRSATPTRMITLDTPFATAVPVLADSDRIGQVITNYLTNALKYSAADHPVEVKLMITGQEALVTVRDEGPGLKAEDQAQLWQRFYRVPGINVLSGTGVGLGLGLHICKTIIEHHHGQVGVESAPGQGSTFWFTLPLIDPATFAE